ncbi:hypothetical protein C0995_014874 [Termitomyces sp. Mi166|nr:hypothetical protein C0995_014874 [Termitomyces sp. Mi166\
MPAARTTEKPLVERTTSEHEFATGIFYPREGESGWVAGGYFYANHRSGHDEDEDVSSRCWSGDDRDDHDHRPTWRDLSEANDDPHSRWNGDSDGDDDWEDNHQGDGSADFQGMFDQERLFGFSEYPEHVGVYHEYDGEYEYDIDSEGDYYEDDDYDIGSGSEVFELESEYGFEYFEYLVGSSGDEESNASESDVGSCDIYYSDSD